MAAGQGFKTFTTGEVLTAGDVNGYLMQGINVFATTTARDAAITAPAEGQFAFTKDTNGLWYYDGAAWVASGATGDIEGVTAGVGISGGGTSGTVTVTNSMATAIDAKGDLVPGTGADTFSRLAVGANGTVLTADSTEATGLKWATASAGGMTLISTINASAATSVSFASIPTTYKHLLLVWKKCQSSSVSSRWDVRLNSDTDSDYTLRGVFYNGTTTTTFNVTNNAIGGASTYAPILETAYSASLWDYACNGYMWLYDYTATSYGVSYSYESMASTEGSSVRYVKSMGTYNNSAAVTEIDFIRNSSQTITGQFLLYGVS
jgi:hypothetical protein